MCIRDRPRRDQVLKLRLNVSEALFSEIVTLTCHFPPINTKKLRGALEFVPQPSLIVKLEALVVKL